MIARARQVLSEHESAEHQASGHLGKADGKSTPPVQLTIFTPLSSGVIEQLRETDLDRVTPLEALNLLHELKQQIE